MASKKKDKECPESPTGKHKADPQSASTHDAPDWVIDYNCKYCGLSGSVSVDPKDMMW